MRFYFQHRTPSITTITKFLFSVKSLFRAQHRVFHPCIFLCRGRPWHRSVFLFKLYALKRLFITTLSQTLYFLSRLFSGAGRGSQWINCIFLYYWPVGTVCFSFKLLPLKKVFEKRGKLPVAILDVLYLKILRLGHIAEQLTSLQ